MTIEDESGGGMTTVPVPPDFNAAVGLGDEVVDVDELVHREVRRLLLVATRLPLEPQPRLLRRGSGRGCVGAATAP